MSKWTCKERATTQCPAPRFSRRPEVFLSYGFVVGLDKIRQGYCLRPPPRQNPKSLPPFRKFFSRTALASQFRACSNPGARVCDPQQRTPFQGNLRNHHSFSPVRELLRLTEPRSHSIKTHFNDLGNTPYSSSYPAKIKKRANCFARLCGKCKKNYFFKRKNFIEPLRALVYGLVAPPTFKNVPLTVSQDCRAKEESLQLRTTLLPLR